MIYTMKSLLFFIFICLPTVASAQSVFFAEPDTQHTVIPITKPTIEQRIYGELKHHPHTFEFVASEDMRLYAEVSIPRGSKYKKSLIAIREEKRGVSEVGRVSHSKGEWHRVRDWTLGRFFETQHALEADITAGVYRIEVSSPENLGKYKLVVGTESSPVGIGKKLSGAIAGAQYFGTTPLAVLKIPIVFLSFIMLCLCLLYIVYKRKYA